MKFLSLTPILFSVIPIYFLYVHNIHLTSSDQIIFSLLIMIIFSISLLFGINLILGLFFLITWLTIALMFKYSSLSSLIATTIAPIYFIVKGDNYTVIFLMYLLSVIVIKHHENIKRLLNRTENKIKLSK